MFDITEMIELIMLYIGHNNGYVRKNNDSGTPLVYGKQQTPSVNSEKQIFNLSWSHYLKLMRINNENKRRFYEMEAINRPVRDRMLIGRHFNA